MTQTQKHQQTYGFIQERICCGWEHAVAILEDGSVKACGDNRAHQCDLDGWTDIVKIRCGPHRTVGLRKDGTVLSTKGDVFSGGRIPGADVDTFSDMIDIDTGLCHIVGLRSDGTVAACGFNDHGQCDVEDWQNVKQIFAERNHTIALCHDGSLLYCGSNDGGSLNLEGIQPVKSLYCGLNDTVIVTTDNQVYRTDYDSKTPIQLGITGDDIAQVDFNVDHFMILKADGTVLHFGFTEDRCDEVGDWTDILHIHCSKKASVGMDKDVVYMTGTNGTSTHKLDNLAWHLESEQIAVFVTKKGIATVFPRDGADAYDSFQLFEVIPTKATMEKEQLQTATPIEISAQPHKSGIAWEHYQKYGYLRKRLSGGLAHCAGIMYNGTAKAVGSNNYNQCDVYDWRDMTQIVCTLCATIGLCKDGTIRHAGQIHISDTCSPGGTPLSKWPSNIKSITSFLHSDTHVVGLTEDGKAVAYGCNENGQCDLAHWRDITEVAAHYGFTAGVRKDGTVVVCGNVSTIENTVSKWTNIEHIFKGVGEQTLIGLKYDGTVVTAGMDAQFDMSGWKDIIDISVGCRAIVGLTGNGHLYVTGKASDQYLLNGIDGVLCANVQQDLLRFTRGKNDTNLLWICRDEIPEIIEFGSLEYQNGYLSSIAVLETGEVIVSVFDDEVRYGQNETDDWQMLEPSPDSAPSSAAQSSSSGSASASSGGCYVATCVYGSYDCPEVWTLRRFRDDTLGSTWYGRAFIHTYYAVSPTFVKWFGETTWFKKMWRGTLDRMVQKLLDKGVENTPYEDKEW